MEFVCDRVAESEKTTCISGNNSDGASQGYCSFVSIVNPFRNFMSNKSK